MLTFRLVLCRDSQRSLNQFSFRSNPLSRNRLSIPRLLLSPFPTSALRIGSGRSLPDEVDFAPSHSLVRTEQSTPSAYSLLLLALSHFAASQLSTTPSRDGHLEKSLPGEAMRGKGRTRRCDRFFFGTLRRLIVSDEN